MKKRWIGMALVAGMLLGLQTTALAAEKIDDVSLTFRYENGKEPESGDYVGGVSVTVPSESKYEVSSAWYLTESELWAVGDRPVVKVYLYANDGYVFGYSTKSHFQLSGCNATYKTAKRTDGNTVMELEVYLKRIGGTLNSTNELEWSGTTAVWEEIYGAKSYAVRLKRNGNTVTTVKTSNNYYDFSGNFTRKGDYTFNVRGISEYNNSAGEWSGDSEEFYVDSEDLKYLTGNGRWVQNQVGWWYSYDNGSYPYQCWKYINGAWYYFNRDGYMTTGWQYVDSEWYYMAASGAMQTGWQFVNGRWYYMDGSGVMQTGWQYVNGRWYCMDQNGAMYANTRTPDGYYVDASGARIY